MRRNILARILGAMLMLAAVLGIFGSVVMSLWNWLMPALFKLPECTFSQAIGLLALSWIFFGSWRGFHGHWHGHHRRRERHLRREWARMTPEQREEFRNAMHCRWSRSSATAPAQNSPEHSPGNSPENYPGDSSKLLSRD